MLKVIYRAIPGFAEPARIMLTMGKVPFEDFTITDANWPEWKLKMPFGQLPGLQLADGRFLAQAGAIDRYVAQLAGLYPADPVAAAFADQAYFLVQETLELMVPTWAMATPEAGAAARTELMAGKVKDKLLLVAKLLAHSPYLAGDALSFADIRAFWLFGMMRGVPGVSPTWLDDYPLLKAHFQRVANTESIKARYAGAAADRAWFQPLE